MKIKTFNKKLVLNKKTVANLNNDELKDVRGGVLTGTCITCWITLFIGFTCALDCGEDTLPDLPG